MSFSSEDRAAELRELFFESAQELLQALNEEGLELEKNSADPEVIRTIRRTVHTLKGDSATCGFRELSELAHELENVLTPELAAREDNSVAQVVLSAADMFDAMLAAYRGQMQPPDAATLREMIQGIAQQPAVARNSAFEPKFCWSEYEQLAIKQGAAEKLIYNVAVQLDPDCPFRPAGVQLVRKTLSELGTVLAVVPEEGTTETIEAIEAVVASDHDESWITRKCTIPGVVRKAVVRPYAIANRTPTESEPKAGSSADASSPVNTGNGQNSPRAGEAKQTSPAPNSESSASPAAATKQAPVRVQPENLLRVDAERVDAVMNLVGELIVSKSMLHQCVSDFSRRFPKDPLRSKFSDVLANQIQVLNELQRSVMKVRMVPVEQLFRRFPRLVRDVSNTTGRQVTLELSGQNTDLDKSILDSLAEPMAHLIRNAIDHGIEPAAERLAAGKPEQGTIRISAYHQGNQVVVEIHDDGRGMDYRRIGDKAISKGIVTPDELSGMHEADVLELIFEPGFSTAEKVTAVSGRGVGLDVVKTVLQRMKGSVSIHTRLGEGTTFRLQVPLTLAIIKALMFRVGERLYAVPLTAVLEITRAGNAEIHSVDHHNVLQLRDEILTLVPLDKIAGANAELYKTKRAFIIVVIVGGRKFGLVVDRVLGEEELVIKALDDQLIGTELISGASILGDGSVVLILNIAAVVEKLGRVRSSAARVRGSVPTAVRGGAE